MVGHGNVPIEVAKTVLEVAEVAWSAIETHHHIHQHHHDHDYNHDHDSPPSNHDLESLRTENRRLRSLLQKNLELFQDLSHSPCLSKDCPPDVRIPFSVPRLVSQILSSIFIYLFIFLRRFIWNSRLEKKIVHRQHTFGCLWYMITVWCVIGYFQIMDWLFCEFLFNRSVGNSHFFFHGLFVHYQQVIRFTAWKLMRKNSEITVVVPAKTIETHTIAFV